MSAAGAVRSGRWSEQRNTLRHDVVYDIIERGRPLVANIAGSTTDTDGDWHGFPNGHYVAFTDDLADWIGTRAYSG